MQDQDMHDIHAMHSMHNMRSGTHGSMRNAHRRFWTGVMILGLLLLSGSLGLVAYNLYTEQAAGARSAGILQDLAAEMQGDLELAAGGQEERALSADGTYSESLEMPILTVDGLDYVAAIHIPKIAIELPVLAEWSYPHLRIAPCRFYGSLKEGNLVIIAHNYMTHFGNLKTLSEGDEVKLLTLNGVTHSYQVQSVTVLSPFATADVVSGEWPLTLCTCTIGGRTRVVVRCDSAD